LSLRPIWSGRPPRALALLAVGGGWIWISVSPTPFTDHSPHTAIQSKREREKLSSKKECAFRSNYLKLDYVYNTNDPQMCSKKGCLDRAHWYYTRRTYVTVCSLFGKLAVVSSSPDWSGQVRSPWKLNGHSTLSHQSPRRPRAAPSVVQTSPAPFTRASR
jgi:hypothetical protein